MVDKAQQEILDDFGAEFDSDVLKDAGVPESRNAAAGDAIVEITNIYLNRSKASSRRQCTSVMKVLWHAKDANSVGMSVTKNYGLETPENIKWFNNDLQHLGLPLITSKEVLASNVAAMHGKKFKVTLADNKDPQYGPTVYVNAGALKYDEALIGSQVGKAPAGGSL